jgi:hypothetical protein
VEINAQRSQRNPPRGALSHSADEALLPRGGRAFCIISPKRGFIVIPLVAEDSSTALDVTPSRGSLRPAGQLASDWEPKLLHQGGPPSKAMASPMVLTKSRPAVSGLKFETCLHQAAAFLTLRTRSRFAFTPWYCSSIIALTSVGKSCLSAA